MSYRALETEVQNFEFHSSCMLMCDPDSDSEDLSMIDKIVVVCAALCNCCDSVVPFD